MIFGLLHQASLAACLRRLSPAEAQDVTRVRGFLLAPRDMPEGFYTLVQHDDAPRDLNGLIGRAPPLFVYLCGTWQRRAVPSQVRPGRLPAEGTTAAFDTLRANVDPALAAFVRLLWSPQGLVVWADRRRRGQLVGCAWCGLQAVASLASRPPVAEPVEEAVAHA